MQEKLDISFNDEIYKVCDLKRKDTPLIAKVELDEYTDLAQKNFDFDFTGENKFYPFELPKELEDLDFNILCIVGASGSGKSTFSKYFGEEEKLEYDNNKSIISHFNNPDEATEKLLAVGLSSIPTWCKPRNVLSVGEGFRIDLARRLKDNCVIDEFTSTVDRNVALSCASSISKYIRKKQLKKCVFVSCHKDFIDVLCPDYVIDLDEEALFDTRGLPRRRFEISIYSRDDKEEVWKLFRQYHYLSADLNKASNVYVAMLDNEAIGFCAILPQPHAYCTNGYRIHRLVIKPDYQGLGLGMKFLEFMSEYYNSLDKVMYIRTTHVKLINALKKSDNWTLTSKEGKISPPQTNIKNWKIDVNRFPCSFQYIKNNIEKKKAPTLTNKQSNIFDFIGE